MATNLMNVFKTVDLQSWKNLQILFLLRLSQTKKTGAKIARAVLDDGTTLIKTALLSCFRNNSSTSRNQQFKETK